MSWEAQHQDEHKTQRCTEGIADICIFVYQFLLLPFVLTSWETIGYITKSKLSYFILFASSSSESTRSKRTHQNVSRKLCNGKARSPSFAGGLYRGTGFALLSAYCDFSVQQTLS